MASPTTLPIVPPRHISKISPLLSEPDLREVAQAHENFHKPADINKPGQTGPIHILNSRDSSYTSVDSSLSFNDSPSPTGVVPVPIAFAAKTPMLNEAMDLAAGFHTLASLDHIHRLSAVMHESERALQEAQRNLAKETKLREGAVSLYKLHLKGNVEQSKSAYNEAKVAQKRVEECMATVFRESAQLTASSTSLLRHSCATLRYAVLELSQEADKERHSFHQERDKLLEQVNKLEKSNSSSAVQTLHIADAGILLNLSLQIERS
jgi:hypothetical protein